MNESTLGPTPEHSNPSLESKILISVIIGVFLVVGSTGSLTTILVIGKNKHLQTKANAFIFSLCISDLISALVCSPLWLYRRTWGFQFWYLSEATCQFYWVVDYATNYLTSLHIVSFSALRYIAIKKPFQESSLSQKTIAFYILALWALAFLSACPLAFLMGVDLERVNAPVGSCWPSCSIANKGDCCVEQYKVYMTIMNSIMFFFPEFCIITFSILITLEIRKITRQRQVYFTSTRSSTGRTNATQTPETTRNQATVYCNTVTGSLKQQSNADTIKGRISTNRNTLASGDSSLREKGAYLQLILIVIAYGIGYIPTTVYLQWSTSVPETHKKSLVDYWFGVVSYLTLRLSECLNPFMYNLGSSTLRKETKKFIKQLFCCES